MKNFIVILLAILISFFTNIIFVGAQEGVGSTTPEQRRAEVEQNLQDRKERVLDAQAQRQENLAEKQAEMQAKQEERVQNLEERRAEFIQKRNEKIIALSERMLRRIEAALTRMDNIIERTESRISKLGTNNPNVDISEALGFINEAKIKMVDERQKVSEARFTLGNTLTSDNPKEAFKEMRASITELVNDIKEIHSLLKDAVKSIKAQTTKNEQESESSEENIDDNSGNEAGTSTN